MKTIIIGCGASGMMASLFIKGDVLILEKNDQAGKKILATGNGRCNISNKDQSLEHYHSTNNELIKNIISDSNINNIFKKFKDLGIELRNKDNYLYPYSNQASSVRDAFLNNIINRRNIKIIYNEEVNSIEKDEFGFIVKTNNNEYESDKLIIASGSSAGLNNEKELFNILKNFGHSIIPVLPALVKLNTILGIEKKWSGIRNDAKVSHFSNNKLIRSEMGEIQFTDYGLSGICIMQLSSQIAINLNNKSIEDIHINFLNGLELDSSNIDKFIMDREKKTNMALKDIFNTMINDKLIKTLFNYKNIDSNKYYSDLNTHEKEEVCNLLIDFKVNIISTKNITNAQTISGGIPLTEINLKTMESLIVKDLFITGELLDINGDCGGYNLTSAFITGYLAGLGVNND